MRRGLVDVCPDFWSALSSAGCGGGPSADDAAQLHWRADQPGTIAWGHGGQPWELERSTLNRAADVIADLSAG